MQLSDYISLVRNMAFKRKYLIHLSIFFGLLWIGCSSGEYQLEEHQTDYVEKTLKYDTVKKVVVVDTTKKDTDINQKKNNTNNDSYSYIVQIGAFIIKSNFERFFASAKTSLGDQVFYEQTSNLYKIRIGNYSNKAEALKQLDFAKEHGYYDSFIVTVKK